MRGKVLVVGSTGDLMQLLGGGLPVLLGYHFDQFLVELVPANLGLAECQHVYSLLAPSTIFENIK